MTKEFYQILGVNEEATLNEIKKAYRKLASQWHPDKWSNSSLEELEAASEQMKKINQAYGVLADEEKRKKYDVGIEISDSNPEAEAEILKEEIEEIRRKRRIIEEFLLHRRATNEIENELSKNKVHTVDLDPQLWAPHRSFVHLLWEIGLEKEVKDAGYNDWKPIYERKINDFKNKMIEAIRKRGAEIKAGINVPRLDRARTNAINHIERKLAEKGLKAEDLGENANYREKINSLVKDWEVEIYREKVVGLIFTDVYENNSLSSQENKNSEEVRSSEQEQEQMHPLEKNFERILKKLDSDNEGEQWEEKAKEQARKMPLNSTLRKKTISTQEENPVKTKTNSVNNNWKQLYSLIIILPLLALLCFFVRKKTTKRPK